MIVGLIADTHGLLRPDALAALAGSERILHAGDVGKPAVLEGLAAVAPVDAVRGNVDRGAWADALPASRLVAVGPFRVLLVHERADADPTGCDAVVYGHSHKPLVERIGGVLWVNPGSAGPRRFHLPIAVARLVATDTLDAEIVLLG